MARPQQITSRTFSGAARVLVVEDDVVARMILGRWFDRWEVSYDMFACPMEVMSRLGQNPYRLALIDYHLPYMNGLDLVREIRSAAKRYTYTPPSFAIHTTDADVRVNALREEVNWFLLKPVPHEHLAMILSKSGCAPALGEDAKPAAREETRSLRQQRSSFSTL